MKWRRPFRMTIRQHPLFTLIMCAAMGVAAQDAGAADVHARLQLQQQQDATASNSLAAQQGLSHSSTSSAELRMMVQQHWGQWEGNLHYLADWQHGSGVTLDRQLADAGVTDPTEALAQSDWWRLDPSGINGNRTRSHLRADRMWLGYTGQHLVFRVGRQALTWGSGQVFHPMDLFDPFAPTATDTEYKRGADMLYGQWLFDDGSDVQGIVVPRRSPADGTLHPQSSSAALHWHRAGYPMQSNWLLARDYGDTVLGANLSGPAGDATWSLEAVSTLKDRGGVAVSLDAVISNAFTLWHRNANGFIEYYRNGFGLSGHDYAVSDIPQDLQLRLNRGQVFNTGIDYLAVGGTLEWTPLFQVAPNVIVNVRDHSALAVLTMTDSLRENTDLVVGGQVPMGPQGTEFGGLETSAASGVYLAPSREVYLRLNQYF